MKEIKINNNELGLNPNQIVKKIDANALQFIMMMLHLSYFKKIFTKTLYINCLEISTVDSFLFTRLKPNKPFSLNKEQIAVLQKDLLTFLPVEQTFNRHWSNIINTFPFTHIIVKSVVFNELDDSLTIGTNYTIRSTNGGIINFNDSFIEKPTECRTDNFNKAFFTPSNAVQLIAKLLPLFPEPNHYTTFFKGVFEKNVL